jgi:putative MFS transporter
MTHAEDLTLDQALDRIGIGRFQIKLMLVAGASWAADAMEVLLISFAIPPLMRDWGLSRTEAGLLGTALFVGMMCGAWGWGAITDRIGRRPGFVLTILIDSLFGLLSAFAPGYRSLLLLRALTGFGIGGTLPVDYAITSEFLPRQVRGRWLVYLESFWAVGTLIAAGLAWLIVPRFPEAGWRLLFAASALPGLIVVWVRRVIPESPRYLLVQGREAEARAVVERVARENGVDLGAFRLKAEPAAAEQARIPLAMLFRAPLLKPTLVFSAVWFLLSLAYYGIFTWLPGIFVQRGFDFLRTYENSFILALAQLPGYFSAAFLIERWGRRKTLAAYLIASGIFTYLFAAASGLPAILAAAVLMSFFALGAWGSLYAWTPESYPTTVRATGMGWASAMARVAGIVAPTLGAALLAASLPLALSVYAAAFGLAGIISLAGRETRGAALADTATELTQGARVGPPLASRR